MCLNVFLTGLRETIGSIIRAMRPESLPVALSYCLREQNVFYSRSQFQSNNKQTNYSPRQHNHPTNTYIDNSQPFFNQNQPHPMTNQLNSKTNYKQLQEHPNQSVSQPQYNQQKLLPPEPMGVSSDYSNLK